MEFEWDERKRRSNLAKHGVDFAMVEQIFQKGVVEREDTRRNYGEARVIAFGKVDNTILTVIYTWRDRRRRIISARRARKDEREDYYAATQSAAP